MTRHQHGIFSEGTRAHHHLEFTIHDDATDEALRHALVAVRIAGEDHRSSGGTHLVIGVGPVLWRRLRGDAAPAELVAFPGYASPDGSAVAPATQRDLWVWIHGPGPDAVIDVVRKAVAAVAPVGELELDQPGFVYHDARDMTGFIDGTANPNLDDAAEVAAIAEGPAAGGSMAMTMRFRHDLDAFDAQPVGEQEKVFGRTKDDSTEIDDRPDDAHISRAEVADDAGEELAVYRRSVPWGHASAQGLHFVSFGADLARFDLQLRTMFGLVDGKVDRLLGYTTAETGSFWLCPTADELDVVAPLPEDDD